MRHRTGRVLLAFGVMVALLFVACTGDDEETATPDPTSEPTTVATEELTAAPTEAATEEPTAEPTAEPSAFPLTVRDLLGREVTFEAAPQTIITTSPSAIEVLYAAGGTAVARSETAVHPDGVEALPSIGPSYAPAFEAMITMTPDLVIADASAQAHLAEAFGGALRGVPIVFIGAVGYDDVATSIRLIGQVIGNDAEAETAAASMESALADVEAAIAGMTAPRVLIMNGGIDDFFVALPDSFVGDLVAKAGGDNVAEGQPATGRFPGYTQLSLEAILETDPEVILTITAGGPSLADLVLQTDTYAGLTAVQDGRVHDIDLEVFLQAPGPRAADGLRELARLLYGIE